MIPIECPNCQSRDFKVQQYTWNEQSMSVKDNGELDWGLSDNHDYESEKPVAVVCDACGHDCSYIFRNEIDQYEDNFIPRRHEEPLPALAMLPESTCIDGCTPTCPHVLADYAETE